MNVKKAKKSNSSILRLLLRHLRHFPDGIGAKRKGGVWGGDGVGRGVGGGEGIGRGVGEGSQGVL